MHIKNHLTLPFALIALSFAACSGDDGRDGVNGADGKDGKEADNAGGFRPICERPEFGTPMTGDVMNEIAPAPASIGADVPVTYFGPAPSSVNPKLIGPVKLLKAGTVDLEAGTVTLPLYKGRMRDSRTPVWFILTDTDDAANAAALGLNFSSKLSYAYVPGTASVRTATAGTDGSLTFTAGTVDFAPERAVVGGTSTPFPPSRAEPGSIGDADYSPLVTLTNAGGHTYNAPVVAFGVEDDDLSFCEGNVDHAILHDKVMKICPEERTVTLELTQGFSFGRPVLYLSTEASAALPAALEGATLAPGLADISVGGDDSAFSAVERIFVFTNGPQNIDSEVNPQRQGLSSAIADGASALNVVGGIPTLATDYSPLWDMNLGEWTAEAITKGYRSRMTEEFQILGMAARGFLTGPGGAPYGSVGIVVNCPIVQRLL